MGIGLLQADHQKVIVETGMRGTLVTLNTDRTGEEIMEETVTVPMEEAKMETMEGAEVSMVEETVMLTLEVEEGAERAAVESRNGGCK